jgi:hypothetical protein
MLAVGAALKHFDTRLLTGAVLQSLRVVLSRTSDRFPINN